MGSHARTILRRDGYDPDQFKRAGEKELYKFTIEAADINGAKIGDPTACSGNKCIVREMGAVYALVMPSTAYVHFANGRKKLFRANGVARKQDQLMLKPGDKLILRGYPEAEKTRIHKLKKGKHGRTTGTRMQSWAAQWRNSA